MPDRIYAGPAGPSLQCQRIVRSSCSLASVEINHVVYGPFGSKLPLDSPSRPFSEISAREQLRLANHG